MAIIVGTISSNLFTGTRNTDTMTCTVSAGSNGYLFLVTTVDSSGGPIVTGVTYNGVSMTQVDTTRVSVNSDKIQIWQLANPTVGANSLIITYGSTMFNPSSASAVPVTGSIGTGVFGWNDAGLTTATVTINVTKNSIILAIGLDAGGSITNITIDGVVETIMWNQHTNRYNAGAYSTQLSVGPRNTITTDGGAPCALYVVEILEFVSAVVNTAFEI